MSDLLPIGTLVRHGFGLGGHGPGMIVAYNKVEPQKYVQEKLCDVVNMIGKDALMLDAISSCFYSKDNFPYVLAFSNGYKDVYGADNFEVIQNDGLEFILTRQTHQQTANGIEQAEARWPVCKPLHRHGRSTPGRFVWFISGGFTLRYRIYDAETGVGIEAPWKYVTINPRRDLKIEQRLAASYAPQALFTPTWEMEEIARQGAGMVPGLLGEFQGRARNIDFDVYFTYESMVEKDYLNRTVLNRADLRETFPNPSRIRELLKNRDKLDTLSRWACKECGTNHFDEE